MKWSLKQVLKQFAKAMCYLGLFVGMQAFAGIVFALLFGYNFVLENAIFLTVVSDLAAVLCVWLFFALRRKKFSEEVNIRRVDPDLYPLLVLLGAGLAFVVMGVLSFLPEQVMNDYSEASEILVTEPSVFSVLAEVVFVPFCEEIFFRGLIFSRLKKAMPAGIAVLISAAVFGIVHGTNPVWIGYAFLLGCAFAFVAYKTGSIISTLILHMLFNLLGGVVLPSAGEFIPDLVFYLIAAVSLVGCVLILIRLFRIPAPDERQKI